MFKIPEDYENKYKFVTLAALRGEQLMLGARPRIESKHLKPTLVAQEEVASGIVEPWEPTDEEAALEEGGEEV